MVDDIPEPAHRLLRGPWTRTRPAFVTGILRQHTGHNAREEVGIWDWGVLSPRADGTASALLATSRSVLDVYYKLLRTSLSCCNIISPCLAITTLPRSRAVGRRSLLSKTVCALQIELRPPPPTYLRLRGQVATVMQYFTIKETDIKTKTLAV